MIKIDQIKLSIDEDESKINSLVAKKLRVKDNDIKSIKILKKSIDARKKPDIYFVFSIIVELQKDMEAKVLDKAKKDNNIK